MRPDELKTLLERTRDGSISVEEAAPALRRPPVEDMGSSSSTPTAR